MYIVLQTPYLAPNLNTENLRVNTTLLPRLPRRSIETALCHSWWDLEVQRVKEGGWKVQCLFSACCPSIDHRGECTVNYGWCSAALTCALFIVVALYVVKLADRLPCYSKKKATGIYYGCSESSDTSSFADRLQITQCCKWQKNPHYPLGFLPISMRKTFAKILP